MAIAILPPLRPISTCTTDAARRRARRLAVRELYDANPRHRRFILKTLRKMKSSANTVPAGTTLYQFEYPYGHTSEATWPCGPDGECVPNPQQCFIESDAEAVKFGRRFGASHITNAVTGKELL